MMKKNTIAWLAILTLALGARAALAAEEVKIEHRGLTLNGMLERTDTWPAGPVVLMTHGSLAHNRMEIMATIQELLTEAGVSSLAINLSLGIDDRHGTLPCDATHTHLHTDAPEEIGRWVAWLTEQGTKRIVLLGHSRSGGQSAGYAAEHDAPEIAGLMLIAPSFWNADAVAASYEESYGVPLAMRLEEAEALVAAGKPDALLEETGFVYCAGAKVAAGTFLSYYSPDYYNTPAILPAVKKPAVVFVGTEDTVVAGLPARIEPIADGARVKLVVIDGADHFFRDLYAEEIVDVIVEELGGS